MLSPKKTVEVVRANLRRLGSVFDCPIRQKDAALLLVERLDGTMLTVWVAGIDAAAIDAIRGTSLWPFTESSDPDFIVPRCATEAELAGILAEITAAVPGS